MTVIRSDRAIRVMALFCLLSLSLTGCGGSQAPEAQTPAATAETPPGVEDGAASPDISDIDLPAEDPMEPLEVSDEFAPAQALGAVEGVPAATNTAPIVAIANFYADLPGLDMSSLTPAQKEKFLQRVNSELCTCGCKNDTLARCYVNDKSCTTVRETIHKVLQEVRQGP